MIENETIINTIIKLLKSLTNGITCEQIVEYVKHEYPNVKSNDIRKCVEDLNNNPKVNKQLGYIYWMD